MFSQDYERDDEASGDERCTSPRGAGGSAVRYARKAEEKMNAGYDIFGSRRGRVSRGPFGGEAFGVAPQEKDLIHMERMEVSGCDKGDRIIELRDYSSKAVLQNTSARMQARSGDPMTDMKLLEAKFGGSRSVASDAGSSARDLRADREVALLSGSSASRHPPGDQNATPKSGVLTTPPCRSKESTSTSSSSSSSKQKKKKKDKKQKHSKAASSKHKKKKKKKGKKDDKKDKKKNKKDKLDKDTGKDRRQEDDEPPGNVKKSMDLKQNHLTVAGSASSPLKRDLVAAAAERRADEAASRGVSDKDVVEKLRRRS